MTDKTRLVVHSIDHLSMRRQQVTQPVSILIPRRAGDVLLIESEPSSESTTLVLLVHRSRLLFRMLRPLLFASPRRMARSAVQCLVDSVPSFKGTNNWKDHSCLVITVSVNHQHLCNPSSNVLHRKVKLKLPRSRPLPARHVTAIWIQPSVIDLHESAWEGRLIHWENQLIRAQTVAGFLSTLGGAYFMCHHLSSAVVFAQEQQRMARILNDSSMFYKCMINQAYNYIYAGKFAIANSLLAQVQASVKQERPLDQYVLLKMCDSARLFLRRVKKASKALNLHNKNFASSSSTSKTVDDFARIRVYHDESTVRDMIVPFDRQAI